MRGGEGGRQRSMAQMKRKQDRARAKAMGGNVEREKIIREVQLPPAIVVSELAARMAEKTGAVVKALMNSGLMVASERNDRCRHSRADHRRVWPQGCSRFGR